MATQKDIANHLNISQATVSATLRNIQSNIKVSKEMRRRILSTAQDLGYVSNQLARSLKSGRTFTIGLLLPYSHDPYYSALIDALSIEAIQHNYVLIPQFHQYSSKVEKTALRRFIETRVEGILLHLRGEDFPYADLKPLFKASRIPIVVINSTQTHSIFHGCMEKDYEREGFIAATELLKLGHRRIDLMDSRQNSIMEYRAKGMRLAIKASGVKASVQIITLAPKVLASLEPAPPVPFHHRMLLYSKLAETYLNHRPRGTVVFTGNEIVASHLAAEATRRGLSLPGDLSIASSGTKDTEAAGVQAFTSTEYDPIEIAQKSFHLVFGQKNQCIRISPRWRTRQSVADLNKPSGRHHRNLLARI